VTVPFCLHLSTAKIEPVFDRLCLSETVQYALGKLMLLISVIGHLEWWTAKTFGENWRVFSQDKRHIRCVWQQDLKPTNRVNLLGVLALGASPAPHAPLPRGYAIVEESKPVSKCCVNKRSSKTISVYSLSCDIWFATGKLRVRTSAVRCNATTYVGQVVYAGCRPTQLLYVTTRPVAYYTIQV